MANEIISMASYRANVLVHTPGNGSSFLRGDNEFTNTLTGRFILNRSYDTDQTYKEDFTIIRGVNSMWMGIDEHGASGIWTSNRDGGWLAYSDANGSYFKGLADAAIMLNNTPNDNGATFLRGDNTWGNSITSAYITSNEYPIIFTHYGSVGDARGFLHIGANSAELLLPKNAQTKLSFEIKDSSTTYANTRVGELTVTCLNVIGGQILNSGTSLSTTADIAITHNATTTISMTDSIHIESTTTKLGPRIGFSSGTLGKATLGLLKNNKLAIFNLTGTRIGILVSDIEGLASHATKANLDWNDEDIRYRYVHVYLSDNRIPPDGIGYLDNLTQDGMTVGTCAVYMNLPSRNYLGNAHCISLSNLQDLTPLTAISQLLFGSLYNGGLWYRTSETGLSTAIWYKILDSDNYTDYTVTKTGGGAIGTWPINISGLAENATRAVSSTTCDYPSGFNGRLLGVASTPVNENYGTLIVSWLRGNSGANGYVSWYTQSNKINLVLTGSLFSPTIGSTATPIQTIYATNLGSSSKQISKAYINSLGTSGSYCTSGYFTNLFISSAIGSLNSKVPSIYATEFHGKLNGNASTASTWAQSITLQLNGAVTGSTTIKGGSNVTINTTVNHTHSYAGSDFSGGPANYLYYKGSSSIAEVNFCTSGSTILPRYICFNLKHVYKNGSNISSQTLTDGSITRYYFCSYSNNRDTTSSYVYAGRVYNAYWNDYAEFRTTVSAKPGLVVIDCDNGELNIADKRLLPGAQIISDTYGHAMGQSTLTNTPVAVAGRVLAYPYGDKNKFHAGMAVCSAPGGTVDIMSKIEKILYPDCIIGYVSEIPTYEEWGPQKIKVNGRIWIRV